MAFHSKVGQASINSTKALPTSYWNWPLLLAAWAKPKPNLIFSQASIYGRSKSIYDFQLRSAPALMLGPWLSVVLNLDLITKWSPCFTQVGVVNLIEDKFLLEKIWGLSVKGRTSTLTSSDYLSTKKRKKKKNEFSSINGPYRQVKFL